MINILHINWLASIISLFALSFLGFIWFGILMTKHYAIAMGKDPNVKPKMPTIAIVAPMITNFIVILTTSILYNALHISTFADAIIFGLVIGVGYLSAMVVTISINPNFPRPFYYSMLNVPYFILGALITVSVLFFI